MLAFFLGPNTFLKQKKISALQADLKLPTETGELSETNYLRSDLLNQDLFSRPKIFILENNLTKTVSEKVLLSWVRSRNHIFILDQSSGKPSEFVSSSLKNESVAVEKFELPQVGDLRTYAWELAQKHSLHVTDRALNLLVEKLFPNTNLKYASKTEKESSLLAFWRVENEILKLASFANTKQVDVQEVNQLVITEESAEGFAVSNALAEKNPVLLFALVEKYFKQGEFADQKALFILLLGLLSEQVRSLLILKFFLEQKINDHSILEKTGWKPTRLFILKKHCKNFETTALEKALEGFRNLDLELKTSGFPPRAVLDLILVQLIA